MSGMGVALKIEELPEGLTVSVVEAARVSRFMWIALLGDCEDGILCGLGGCVRASVRLSAQIEQAFRADLLVPVDPPIAGWPRHPKLTAQVRK